MNYFKHILIVFIAINLNAEHKTYLISRIEAKKNSLVVIPESEFKRTYLTANFRALYDSEINLETLDEQFVTIPFVMSVISVVWQSGKTYWVKKMDATLMKSLERVKQVFKAFYPEVAWDGQLLADEVITHNQVEQSTDTVGLVFSGGVDSTYTSLVHHDKKQLLITYLGFSEEIESKNWSEVCNQCRSFANEYGNRENYFVKSNFRFFVKLGVLHRKYPSMDSWREFCQEALSLAGLAAPILVQKNCNKFYISSSWDWGFPYAWGSHPFIDDNIAFEQVQVKDCDYAVSRQQKIKHIAKFCRNKNLKKPIYHVCRGGNHANTCTLCEKCLRTLNGLIVEEETLEEYGFQTTRELIFERTRNQFSHGTTLPRFTIAVAHIWQDIQKRAQERLNTEEMEHDLALKEYLKWLCSVDFNYHINLFQFTRKINFNDLMDTF